MAAALGEFSESETQFLSRHHHGAMITVAPDGTPKVARVAIGVVDGKIWSGGTLDRVRTRRLRRDPRCTFYVQGRFPEWLSSEGDIRIIDGQQAPQANLRLTRAMLNRPDGPVTWFGEEMDEDRFLQTMVEQQRIVYELVLARTYGSVSDS